MADRREFLYNAFLKRFKYDPTPCQEGFFRTMADFMTANLDGDILVVNGYAGTGKTTAVSAVIRALKDMGGKSVLLAPTGRAAKVFAGISGLPASTIHKHIYRQKSGGFANFSLAPNKAANTLFVVDEVSLIGSGSGSADVQFGSGNLLEDLITFVRGGADCRLVLVGDAAQLPPVGMEASPALHQMYMEGFGGVNWCTLTSVMRQADESGILRNATRLREVIESAAPDDMFGDAIKIDLSGTDDIVRISGGELIDSLTDAYSRYGEDGCVVLCRSNKRAIRYNLGIRSMVHFKEEQLLRGDRLMVVKNCYQFLENVPQLDYIANGDMAVLERLGKQEERYGLHFADARLSFPDYDVSIDAKILLDTLQSETPALSRDQQNALYEGVSADYAGLGTKKKIWDAVREDRYFNALQIKYGEAVTCHKAQGGQWDCVFIDCPFWTEEQTVDDLKWLYTALTRAVKKVYLINFKDRYFL